MSREAQPDDPRRRLLIDALAAGLFAVGVTGGNSLSAQILGSQPVKLPPGQSVFRARGNVTVNGQAVTQETQIRPGDTVRTGKDSEIIFVVTDSSMLLRADSQLELRAESGAIGVARLTGWKLTVGRLLSVYPPGAVEILTATATVRIRGTGVYVESDPEQTYFCTCYGATEVTANDDPDSRETVVATHHDRPLYILAGANNRGKSIRPAKFINHTDQELALIETLVGRTPPFVFPKQYQAPRRTY